MKLIGLTGRARSGKDTVAAILRRTAEFQRLAFADPIKDMLIALGLKREQLEEPRLKEQTIDWIGRSPRFLMQTLGTEWGRHLVRDDLWIRCADARLYWHLKIGQRVVVTDVRFNNEADWVRTRGGEVWHVTRPMPANVVPMTHASELGVTIMAGADSVVANDQGLEQLEAAVRAALAGELRIQDTTA